MRSWASLASRPVLAQLGGQVGDLGVADVVGGQLGRGELRAAPLARRLALLLEAALGHQRHRLRLGHPVGVHPRVQDRVDHHAQLHLQLLHAHRGGVALARVPVVGHQLLGVDRPALDERARPERGPQPGSRRRTGARARAAGNGRASPRAPSGCAPCAGCTRGRTRRPGRPASRRRRRDRDERRQRRWLERPRRVAVGDRDAPVDLRHVDQLDRVVVDA